MTMTVLSRSLLCTLVAAALALAALPARAQTPANEDDFYRISTLPIPEDVVLEVGGMAFLPDGRLAVSTRRGEIWIVENPGMHGGTRPYFQRFARGLHEPLGLAYRDGALYAAQRGELTRMRDRDGDGRADLFETVYSWPLEGNYHEYAYGPVFRPDGKMLVTLNLAWIGYGASLSKWHGWMLEIGEDGSMTPVATGMRSPSGIGTTPDGAVFYADNQGDWIGSGYITHVEPGDFVGNPAGLRWSGEPGSPIALRPEDVPDTGEPLFEVARELPALKPPAVWFPHGILGISTSAILADTTGGTFGPFAGQLFVGDQGHSKINRVFLEEVNGVYQGVVFPFLEGFQSGVLRLAWGPDDALYVGQTSRGWDATGKDPYGLQRVEWTGQMPFEVKAVRARPDGFEFEFTKAVDPATAGDPASYAVTSFTYRYHRTYGSDPVNQEKAAVRAVELSEDGLRARIAVDALRQGYVHEIKLPGIRSRSGEALLHPTGYYTLNEIPGGERMNVAAAASHGSHASSSHASSSGASSSNAASSDAASPARAGSRERTSGGVQPAKNQTEQPGSWTNGPDVTIAVGTRPGLEFDLGAFDVPAGARVKLVFTNSDDMLHNFVLTAPGTVDAVAKEALELGLAGPEMHYVPENAAVLYHTKLLQPETAETIYFEAPSEPGSYPFVCTFPGHAVSMRGVMRVL